MKEQYSPADRPDPARQVRLQVATGITSIVIGLMAILVRVDIGNILGVTAIAITLIGALLATSGLAQLLLLYLRGAIKLPGIPEASIELLGAHTRLTLDNPAGLAVDELSTQVAGLRRELEEASLARGSLSQLERDKLIASLNASIRKDLASQVAATLETRYGKAAAERSDIERRRGMVQEARLRLSREIDVLSRRGNLNLVIGTLTTVVAGVALGYMVFRATDAFASLNALLSFYIPRVSTILFIEVFAFFFLRLYKASLSDIKYYQNELTMLESRAVAIELATSRSDARAIEVVIDRLASDDRNRADRAALFAGNAPPAKETLEVVDKLLKLLEPRSAKG